MRLPKWLRIASRPLFAALMLICAYCTLVIIDAAYGSIHFKTKPNEKYRFLARENGHILTDERGDALRFESRQAADDYAARYRQMP